MDIQGINIWSISEIINIISKYSEDILVSGVLYIGMIYLQTNNVVRQWMAVSIFLLAFGYIINNNIKKYIFWIFIAMLFHFSAVSMLLLYPIICLNINIKIKEFVILVISFVARLSYSKLFYFVIYIATQLGTNYSKRYELGTMYDVGNYTPFCIILFMVIILVFFVQRRHTYSKQEEAIIMYLFVALGLSLLAPVNTVFNRLCAFTYTSMTIAYASMMKLIKKNGSENLIRVGIIVLASISFIF